MIQLQNTNNSQILQQQNKQIINSNNNNNNHNKSLNNNQKHKNNNILSTFQQQQSSRYTIQQKQHNIFIKIILGKYFIQGYRIFKFYSNQNLIILIKKSNRQTIYHFLYFIQNIQILRNQLVQQGKGVGNFQCIIEKYKKDIQKFIKRQLNNYQISIVFVEQVEVMYFQGKNQYCQFLQKSKNQLNQIFDHLLAKSLAKLQYYENQHINLKLSENDNLLPFKIINFLPKRIKQSDQILIQTKKQLIQLKNMLATYIDTFTNQQKASYIYKQMQKSSTSFSIQTLLNTLHYIIYQQTKNRPYNQLQSAYWTCFEKKSRSLHQDRKHFVLTGNGQCCILEIIFMTEIQKQKQNDYIDMLLQCKKFYKKAKVKVYRITNVGWNGEVKKIVLLEEDEEGEMGKEGEDKINININENRQDEQGNRKNMLIYKFNTKIIGQY